MHTLIINDLSVTAELDAKAMTAVRGGSYGGWKMPSYFSGKTSYEHSSYPSPTTTTTISVDQANNQMQSNATGNGSAVFGGGISAWNNQQGINAIG